jgi:hypothetical protein
MPKNDYNLEDRVGDSCPTGGSGTANAAANVGSGLFAYAHLTTAEDTNDHSPTEKAVAKARDTVQLNPPTGFTGRSIKVKIMGAYGLQDFTSGHGFATACWQFTGLSKAKCDGIANGQRDGTYSSQVAVNKDNTGKFQFYIFLSGGVQGSGGGGASALMGTPFISPPNGWTYTWASGE